MGVLQAETWHSKVLCIIPGFKIRSICFIVWLWDKGHGTILQIVPVDIVEKWMLLEVWKKIKNVSLTYFIEMKFHYIEQWSKRTGHGWMSGRRIDYQHVELQKQATLLISKPFTQNHSFFPPIVQLSHGVHLVQDYYCYSSWLLEGHMNQCVWTRTSHWSPVTLSGLRWPGQVVHMSQALFLNSIMGSAH